MIREPKRDYRIAILLAFLAVICCVPIAGANDSNGTVALDNATGISGNSTPVETTMIVPTDTSGTSPTPTPIPTADFTVPLTSKSITARSAVQSLDASTSTPTWVQQTAAPGWVSRSYHSSVAMPDGTIVLMGGLQGSNLKNDVWRSMDKGVTWTQMTGAAGWSTRWFHHSSVAMSDGTIVLMGGSGFGSTFVNDVWRSTDNGATWTQLPDAGWSARGGHTSVSLSDGSIVLMGASSDVWRLPTTSTPPQTGSISISSDPLGAKIYLNDVYQGLTPLSLENIPFGVHVVKLTLEGYEDWTDNVELTAASRVAKLNPTLSPVPPTYSITIIEDYWIKGYCSSSPWNADLINCNTSERWGTEVSNKVKYWLGQRANWGDPVFEHKDENVTREDFGTQNGDYEGLDESTIHYYMGHGFCNVCVPPEERNPLPSTSGLELFNWGNSSGDQQFYHEHLAVTEVNGMWDNRNKWVIFQTCEVVGDPAWGKALKKSHGILGFKTEIVANDKSEQLPDKFFKYAIEDKMTIAEAWRQATVDQYQGIRPASGVDIEAVVIFNNDDQYLTDHLPGMGSVAPDENPNDGEIKRYIWNCSNPEKGGS